METSLKAFQNGTHET